jgi:DNA-binding MarR family transcriptional regulator
VPEARAAKECADAGDSAVADSRQERLTEVGLAFRHAYRSLGRLRGRDTHLGNGAIGHAQFELLADLRERGPLSASDLAAASGLSPATISQMLDHLAECGQVERVRSETDRRVVVTKLTRNGRRRLDARKEMWRARWREAMQDFDEEELRIAAKVLDRVGGIFEESPERPSPRPGLTGAAELTGRRRSSA